MFRLQTLQKDIPFCVQCAEQKLIFISCEASDEAMEDWYEYELEMRKIDKSEIEPVDIETEIETCNLCGKTKQYGIPRVSTEAPTISAENAALSIRPLSSLSFFFSIWSNSPFFTQLLQIHITHLSFKSVLGFWQPVPPVALQSTTCESRVVIACKVAVQV